MHITDERFLPGVAGVYGTHVAFFTLLTVLSGSAVVGSVVEGGAKLYIGSRYQSLSSGSDHWATFIERDGKYSKIHMVGDVISGSGKYREEEDCDVGEYKLKLVGFLSDESDRAVSPQQKISFGNTCQEYAIYTACSLSKSIVATYVKTFFMPRIRFLITLFHIVLYTAGVRTLMPVLLVLVWDLCYLDFRFVRPPYTGTVRELYGENLKRSLLLLLITAIILLLYQYIALIGLLTFFSSFVLISFFMK